MRSQTVFSELNMFYKKWIRAVSAWLLFYFGSLLCAAFKRCSSRRIQRELSKVHFRPGWTEYLLDETYIVGTSQFIQHATYILEKFKLARPATYSVFRQNIRFIIQSNPSQTGRSIFYPGFIFVIKNGDIEDMDSQLLRKMQILRAWRMCKPKIWAWKAFAKSLERRL